MRVFIFKQVLFFVFISMTLMAQEEAEDLTHLSVAATEGLPSSVINQSVCAITGEYLDHVVDMVLPGPEPLVMQRSYSNMIRHGNVGKSWNFNHCEHLWIACKNSEFGRGKVLCFLLYQPSGSRLYYEGLFPEKKAQHKPCLFQLWGSRGLTNCASGEISGRTNVNNQKAAYFFNREQVEVTSGAGDVRTFKLIVKPEDGQHMILQQFSENRLNGNGLFYHFSKQGNISSIEAMHMATKQVYSSVEYRGTLHPKTDPYLILRTNCGKEICYRFFKHEYKIKDKQKWESTTHYFRDYYLEEVNNPERPLETYSYIPKHNPDHFQIQCKKKPDGRFLSTYYYRLGKNEFKDLKTIVIDDEDDYRIDRVKLQRAPVGFDQTPITTYQFVYQAKIEKSKCYPSKILNGQTDVFDAYLHKTSYVYNDKQQLTKIEKYGGIDPYILYSTQAYVWGNGQDVPKENLVGHYLQDASGKIESARYFTYDKQGNILVDCLYGNLTGQSSVNVILDHNQQPLANGVECYQKVCSYSQDGLNLLEAEFESNGKITRYIYQPGTNLLIAKMVFCHQQLCIRNFYQYNQHAVLIKTITDDGSTYDVNNLTGVTERKIVYVVPRSIAPINLPQCVDEMYVDLATGQEKLIKRVIADYSIEGRLLKQDYYDSEGVYSHSLTWDYDAHGNVIKELNALGEAIIKSYDANDNLIFQQGPCFDYYTQYAYDFANRLIREEEIHTNGLHLATTHRYNYLGHRIATVNPYGQEILYQYDDWGRLVLTQHPLMPNEVGDLIQPTLVTQYNVLGLPICVVDPKGSKTLKAYNSRGQLTHCVYPDGSQERSIYELDGKLAAKQEKNGMLTRYTRDYQGRVIKEEVFSPEGQLIKTNLSHYNAFHLMSCVDPQGVVTYYQYDGAGRLILTTKEDQIQKQVYDSLSRLIQIQEWFGQEPDQFRSHVKQYDKLNRLIEESIVASDGTVLHLSRYTYDSQGNKTHIQEGESLSYIEYNSFKQPIKQVNALGQTIHIQYDYAFLNPYGQRVLQVQTTDPLGYQTIETYDTANRLAQVVRKNPFGTETACQKIYYDACGNQARVVEAVIQEGQLICEVAMLWVYNAVNEPLMLIEAAWTPEQRITQYTYNPFGQKIIERQPNGIELFYQYDQAGRLHTFKSSDESFHYVYTYNVLDQPIEIMDVKYACTNRRVYDSLGQLKQEILGNGLTMDYDHDRLGRIINVILPDKTKIAYDYQALDLKQIHRIKDGVVYSHTDLSHNLFGQVTQSKLIANSGQVSYQYDLLGRLTKLEAPGASQEVPPHGYNPIGQLMSYQEGQKPYTFTYDDNNQLQKEEGHCQHHYQCDSLSNRVNKDGQAYTINALNQLLQQGDKQYLYDPNGNLIETIQGNEHTEYRYDALNRLIAVCSQGKWIHYLYDSFNRRLTKKQTGQADQHFFYQGLEEIGVYEKGLITQLKVLGNGIKSRAIAIELEENTYAPIYDLFGNIKCLIDLQGQVVEHYRYTAFGEEEILDADNQLMQKSKTGNPWRYAGKRLDAETGFVAFGLRYYDPEVGRWITTDPIGFEDGPNLYTYLHHNPLAYFDAFGLLSEEFSMNSLSSVTFFNFEATQPRFESVEHHLNSWSFADDDPIPFFEFSDLYNLNEGFTNPKTGEPFKLPELTDKRITFNNGIMNNFNDFTANLSYLGELANYNIHGIHCASFGLLRDSLFYVLSTFKYIALDPVKMIHDKWDEFFRTASPNATLLHYCHSRGVTYTKLALMSYPPELRNRIEIVAIAPGAYINKELCKNIMHYVSENDFVNLIDRKGRQMAMKQGTITTLKRAPGSSWWDHDFKSPTYRKAINVHMKQYLTGVE